MAASLGSLADAEPTSQFSVDAHIQHLKKRQVELFCQQQVVAADLALAQTAKLVTSNLPALLGWRDTVWTDSAGELGTLDWTDLSELSDMPWLDVFDDLPNKPNKPNKPNQPNQPNQPSQPNLTRKSRSKRAKSSGRPQKARPVVTSTIRPRQVQWRAFGSSMNERMRGAVWVYRFAGEVPSLRIQKHFGVSVKTLIRYVEHSSDPNFDRFGLFFGMASHALERLSGQHDPADTSVPCSAKQFLEQYETS